MGLQDFRLIRQIGAGVDGVTYLAEPPGGGRAVELRALTHVRGSAGWTTLSRRLRLAARLDAAGTRPIRSLDLDADPPLVTLDADDSPTLADALGLRPELDTAAALGYGRAMAEALTSVQRLGVTVGRIDPWSVRLEDGSVPLLDLTGLETGASPAPPTSAFRAPEMRRETDVEHRPTLEADVWSLAALTCWLATGYAPDDRERTDDLAWVDPFLHPDPTERAPASEFFRTLTRIEAGQAAARRPVAVAESAATGVWSSSHIGVDLGPDGLPSASRETRTGDENPGGNWRLSGAVPPHLGRFRLLEKVGEGGMGEVYRAVDGLDGSVVALKLLRREWAAKPGALARFRKEARMLARVRNPYVTNLLEVNEDAGLNYLVMEYVDGRTLEAEIAARTRFTEAEALPVAAAVARGLSDAHRIGIVHRDVKPSNILMVGDFVQAANGRSASGVYPRVKLTDFGLARDVEQSESVALTHAGSVVGTPAYMAPEQADGGSVDARVDVYSLGVTLFHMLAGRPPFEAEDWRAVVAKHQNEPPPDLRSINPAVSEGLSRVVGKALAKLPEARYADAEGLLNDLERLRRGEPTGLLVHPNVPEATADSLAFDFTWELESSPERLWPLVSNTDRVDRALGFGPVHYTLRADPERGVRRFLAGRKAGMAEEGEELPYEWVEGRRLGVYREYTRGPFRWVVSAVELAPRPGGGTTLTQKLRVAPRGRLLMLATRWGVGNSLRRDFERVYRRIDETVSGGTAGSLVDPFEPVALLSGAQRARLDKMTAQLRGRGVDPVVVDGLTEFIANAAAPELARIRPIALARRLHLDERAVVSACLHGASIGLLDMSWAMLCPVCRNTSDTRDTLRALADHGHCEACQVDYELDFATSVELVFRSHPQVREADANLYCAAGPSHLPHVVAQVRVEVGERLDLVLNLGVGDYRIRGPQLGWSLPFKVRQGAAGRRIDLALGRGPDAGSPSEPVTVDAGAQVVALDNDSGRALLVRVERVAARDDALTAARASSLALFREMFPAEVLAPGRLMNVAGVTLMLSAIDEPASLYETLGDARAFAALHDVLLRTEVVVKNAHGSVVKTVAEGVLAVFQVSGDALDASLALGDALRKSDNPNTRALADRLRLAVHAGPAMAATFNDQLDYFGATVEGLSRAALLAEPGTTALTAAVAGDLGVCARLASQNLGTRMVEERPPLGPIVLLTPGVATGR